MRSFTYLSVTLASMLLVSCGGSSNNNDDDQIFETRVGQFIDGPVANVAYRTTTQSGVTNADGEFSYRPGETVTFSIGGVDIGSALAEEHVTPVSLFGDAATRNANQLTHEAINLAILLVSLDSDSNPDNGIQVSDFNRQIIENGDISTFNFDQTAESFMADIRPVIEASDTLSGELASVENVLAHLLASIAATPADSDLDGIADYIDPFIDDPVSPGIENCQESDSRFSVVEGSANLTLHTDAWSSFGLTLNNMIGEDGNNFPVGPADNQDDLLDLPASENFDPSLSFDFPINPPEFRYSDNVANARLAAPTNFNFFNNVIIDESLEGVISLSGVFRFSIDAALGGGQLLFGDFTLSYDSDNATWNLVNNITFPTTTFVIGNAVLSTTDSGFILNGELLGSAELALLIPQSTGVDFGDIELTARCSR